MTRVCSLLQVSRAMPEDFGEYHCTVQDGFGVTERSRKITVKSKWLRINLLKKHTVLTRNWLLLDMSFCW